MEQKKAEETKMKDGYYTSGEFASMANVSVRTIRFYDRKNILKPSRVSESGIRYYSDEDFARLQQILLLKYLGFSLDDIREMTINDMDWHYMVNSLKLQQKLVQDRIEQLQMVERAVQDTAQELESRHQVDWSQMLELIRLTGMEKSLKSQYQNASNLSARIRLHRLYSQNPEGWFPWVYRRCEIREGEKILELGSGSGSFWTENRERIPAQVKVVVSDLSEGMLRDARREIGGATPGFRFRVVDAHRIPFPDQTFDLVIANHVLFYCEDILQVCREVHRVLKDGGRFVCSTYSRNHMKEISELVQAFDARVTLSAEKLYEKFGLENGEEYLSKCFETIKTEIYQDRLLVDRPEPLVEYVLSCHGNQNQYLLERYKEFRNYVEQKTDRIFEVTKEAGIFVCRKEKNEKRA